MFGSLCFDMRSHACSSFVSFCLLCVLPGCLSSHLLLCILDFCKQQLSAVCVNLVDSLTLTRHDAITGWVRSGAGHGLTGPSGRFLFSEWFPLQQHDSRHQWYITLGSGTPKWVGWGSAAAGGTPTDPSPCPYQEGGCCCA